MNKLLVFFALVAVASSQVYEEVAPTPVEIVGEDFSQVQVVDGVPDVIVDDVHVVDESPGEVEHFDMDNMIIDPGFMMPTVDNYGYEPIDTELESLDPKFTDPEALDRNSHPKISDNPMARLARTLD